MLSAAVLALAIFAALAAAPARWTEWRPATCIPDGCFCEAVRESSIRQPANTASGLVFVPAAAAVLAIASRRRRRQRSGAGSAPLLSNPIYAVLYAGATLLIGLGTAFYHASLSFWGQTADVLGMYLIATLFVLLGAARVWKPGGRVVGLVYVLVNAVLLWALIVAPQARRYVFGALVLTAVALELANRGPRGARRTPVHFLGGLGGFAAGTAAWILDITGAWCSPYSYFQLHAIWHVAGAAALVLMSLHYLQEPGAQLAREA